MANRVPAKGATIVRCWGVIDDSFDRVGFVEGLTGVVIIDLDGVRRITSFGVREWVTAMRTLPADYVAFINVRPTLVSQFNMVSGFAGRGILVTFFTPHICNACGKELEVLLDLRKQYNAVRAEEPPVALCPQCNAPAEFDDVASAYFAYAASQPPPNPPAEANAAIDGDTGPAAATPWKVEKEVDGNVTALWITGALDAKATFKRLADGLEGDVVMVMDGVSTANKDGAERFKQFADTTDFRLYLARVPIALAEVLATNPDACGRAKLVSVRLDFTCSSCGKRVREILDGLNLAMLDSLRSTGKNCPHCWKPLKSDAAPEVIAKFGRLPFDIPAENVATYLDEHTAGPGGKPIDPEGEVWGKYRLVKQIGTGGMGELFLARQVGPEGFEKKVVLKRLLPHISENKLFVEMFLQEARVAARLSHPNVVQIFELGKVGTQYYMAMEYVRGWDLNAILKALYVLQERMPIHLACRMMHQLCLGLGAAHRPVDDEGRSLAIVHRDHSPQNVLLSTEGAVKLTDFGIAKAAGSLTNTEPGMVRGKVAYMSPEQVRGRQDIDLRTDIFAVAVILYQCLTGQSLFHRENQAATLHALLSDPIPAPSSKRQGVPPILDRAMATALQRDRDKRYATALDFAADLEASIKAIGQPAEAADLAHWLHDVTNRASKKNPEIAAIPSFTPTSGARVPAAIGRVTPDGQPPPKYDRGSDTAETPPPIKGRP